MISLIPVVRANAEAFAGAAASRIGSQRMGDQVGSLLAGAYALHSDRKITAEEAKTWIEKQDWTEQTTIQESPDEVLCLQRILQHVTRVPDHMGRPTEYSVGELIEQTDRSLDPAVSNYRDTLLRMGIRVDSETVTIANQHAGIQEIMAGTPWTDWGRILRRIPGAISTPAPVRFAAVKVRGVALPREAISN
jgi:putative DNA primase/helicase